jgi:hypothetical protein
MLNNAAGSVQLEWMSLQDAIARSDPSTAAAAAAASSAGSFRWFGHRHCVGGVLQHHHLHVPVFCCRVQMFWFFLAVGRRRKPRVCGMSSLFVCRLRKHEDPPYVHLPSFTTKA